MSLSTKEFLSEYSRRAKLGEGTYGIVYKCWHEPAKRFVALKKIKIDNHEEGIPATTLRESFLFVYTYICFTKLEARHFFIFFHNTFFAVLIKFLPMFRTKFAIEKWIFLRKEGKHVFRIYCSAKFENLNKTKKCIYVYELIANFDIVSLLKELRHPCIIELEKSLYVDGDLFLVFPYVDNDLKQYLEKCGTNLELPLLKSYSFMLVEGLRHCHSCRVLHRDLKPQNILISEAGDLKIADFGLGREHGLPICKLTHEVVTLWYRPPEILLGQETYSGAADIWGIGCIIAELATRKALFPGDSEIDQLFQIFKILGLFLF
ncbi:cell division protein kinase 2, partial [Reticulomyxa filosa]